MKTAAILAIIAAVIIAVGAFMWYQQQVTTIATISSFEECAAAGYPILESYPEQCRTPDGQSFTRDVGNELEKTDLIRITSPRPGETVSGTITITGEARGTWFFEASFPIHLEDAQGNKVTTVVAQAQGEWMTENFVPFAATLQIPSTTTGPATLVLEKDNPSGLPEHAEELRVPIVIQ
jgi:hypothetical protein